MYGMRLQGGVRGAAEVCFFFFLKIGVNPRKQETVLSVSLAVAPS